MANETNGNGAGGRVLRVIGPVVDVEFPPEDLPEINNALTVERTLGDETGVITMEVAQHIGDKTVRSVACSTFSASQSIFPTARSTLKSTGPFTAPRRRSRINPRN